MIDLPAWLTLTDAARCVGLSKRTLKRRIDDGALSGELRRQGEQEVWMVQAAELQRWAEAAGQALQVPQDLRQVPTEGGAGDMTDGAQDAAASATTDRLRQTLAATEAELAATKARLEAVEGERDRVWAHLQEITPMLPAARQDVDEARRQAAAIAAEADRLRQELERERQRSWWQRIFTR
jgi:hypothetical protein